MEKIKDIKTNIELMLLLEKQINNVNIKISTNTNLDLIEDFLKTIFNHIMKYAQEYYYTDNVDLAGRELYINDFCRVLGLEGTDDERRMVYDEIVNLSRIKIIVNFQDVEGTEHTIMDSIFYIGSTIVDIDTDLPIKCFLIFNNLQMVESEFEIATVDNWN